MTLDVHGVCDPVCEPLRAAFVANFDDGLEVGASLCVMRHGRPLLDIWAGYADFERTRPWARDTIVLVNSSTKVPLNFVMMMLIDRGLVALDAPVATYWPAFAAGGKGAVTVRQVMTFQSGVPGFHPVLTYDEWNEWDLVTANVAAQDHWFGGEPRLCYSPVAHGFILGEIMRRVDGRLPSQFFREEIAEPAGIDLTLGLRTDAALARAARVGALSPPSGPPPFLADPVAARVMASMTMEPPGGHTQARRMAEIPSGNGHANGHSLAKLCAIGAMGGVLDGVRYLSEAIIDEAFREQAHGRDWLFGDARLCLGFGLDSPDFAAPTPSTIHWGGAGGSFVAMDRVTGISVGYAMNNMIFGNSRTGEAEPRSERLWGALRDVMRAL